MGGARCKWPHPSTGKPVKKGKQPNQAGVCHERAREKNDLGRKKQLQGGNQMTPSGEPFPISHLPSGAQSHFGRDLLYSCVLYLSNDEILNELLFPTHPSVPNCCFPMQPAHVRYMRQMFGLWLAACTIPLARHALPGLTGESSMTPGLDHCSFWSFSTDVFTVGDMRKGDKNLQPRQRIC